MAGIDESRAFIPLRIAVLTVSDTRDERTDTSGGLRIDRLSAAGHVLAARAIVRDDIGPIRDQVAAWVADPAVDVVLTTGGTGFSPRDVTPEAVKRPSSSGAGPASLRRRATLSRSWTFSRPQ